MDQRNVLALLLMFLQEGILGGRLDHDASPLRDWVDDVSLQHTSVPDLAAAWPAYIGAARGLLRWLCSGCLTWLLPMLAS
jgi:hypothetical protein